jgi:pimeloyl-ACP methyl ester carboxylesterase
VLGTSGGSPYAMACAAAMLERVTRLGLVVAAVPADAPGMHQSHILRTIPRPGVMRRVQFGMMDAGLKRGRDYQILVNTLANISEVDRPFLERADNTEWYLRMMWEAFKQRSLAASHDAGIYLDSWSFDIARITTETHLWYGARDETVPAPVGEWLADQITNSNLIVWPQQGQFIWMESAQAAEVVATTSGTNPSHRWEDQRRS